MKKRVIWKMFLLQIVTLGLYRVYYLITTRNEMMQLNSKVKIKSPAYLLAPVVLIIAAVILLIMSTFSSVNRAAKLTEASSACRSRVDSSGYIQARDCDVNAEKDNVSGITTVAMIGFYMAFIVSFVLVVVWIWSYAHGAEIVTKGKLGFAMCLIVLLVVPDGIDLLIIQDYFNNLSSSRA